MNAARELVRAGLDTPALIDQLGDDDDLIGGGVNSGELVRIALRCEQRLGRALTDEELAGLSTIHAVATLIETGT
jgi:acyl carrier protein